MRVVKVPALIEPVPIVDDFVQGIGLIEWAGPCLRFVLFAEQTAFEAGNTRARVVVRKLIVPPEIVAPAIKQVGEFMAASTFANVFRIRG
jgi:hypothetical protein